MTKKDLTALTVIGLKALATKKKIALPASAKKSALIAALLKISAPAKKAPVLKKAAGTKKTASQTPLAGQESTDR